MAIRIKELFTMHLTAKSPATDSLGEQDYEADLITLEVIMNDETLLNI